MTTLRCLANLLRRIAESLNPVGGRREGWDDYGESTRLEHGVCVPSALVTRDGKGRVLTIKTPVWSRPWVSPSGTGMDAGPTFGCMIPEPRDWQETT
jgi:hypothetical protein